jgi:hypothetical protein
MLQNFFQHYYVAIGITLVKIIREIRRLVRKLRQKSFIILATFDTQLKSYKEDVIIFFLFSPKTFSSSSVKEKE